MILRPLSYSAVLVAASFAAVVALAQPNTAQVCDQTVEVFVQIEREIEDIKALQWVRETHEVQSGANYFSEVDNADYVGVLTAAIAANKIIDTDVFTAIATALTMDRDAASQGLSPPVLFRDKMAYQRAMLVKLRRLLFESTKQNPRDTALQLERLEAQKAIREQRIADLNCLDLPSTATASDAGAMALTKTKLVENRVNGDCARFNCTVYEYGDDQAAYLIVGDPPDRRQVNWRWEGMPGSLDPGQEFIIKVTGKLDFKPVGSERGANYSAGLRHAGLTVVKEQNAYFYQGAQGDGEYSFQVPLDAKKVEFSLSADNGIATFIRYCYGACTP